MNVKTKIVVEQYQRNVVRGHQPPVGAFCGLCRAESRLIKPETAAAITGRSQREFFKMIETGSVHYFENAAGELFLCGRSLADLGGPEEEDGQ